MNMSSAGLTIRQTVTCPKSRLNLGDLIVSAKILFEEKSKKNVYVRSDL